MAASTPVFFEDITIASENPLIANILLFAAVAGRAEIRGPNSFFLQKGSVARFTVFGNTVGFTRLLVRTARGEIVGSLLVSVKDKLTKTFTLNILRDASHRTTDDAVDAQQAKALAIMQSVRDLYLAQANISLFQIGPPNKPKVDGYLGDTIFLDDVGTMIKIATAVQAANIPGADLHIFYTWDVEDRFIAPQGALGVTLLGSCFVDELPPGPTATFTFAHELGHALFLDHNPNPSSIMFKAFSPFLKRFNALEITILNTTGSS